VLERSRVCRSDGIRRDASEAIRAKRYERSDTNDTSLHFANSVRLERKKIRRKEKKKKRNVGLVWLWFRNVGLVRLLCVSLSLVC